LIVTPAVTRRALTSSETFRSSTYSVASDAPTPVRDRDRVALRVAAADVEQPRDLVQRAHDEVVRVVLLQPLANLREFILYGFPRVFCRVQTQRRRRLLRSVRAPGFVHGVRLHAHEG
jgi:hypothetical protein